MVITEDDVTPTTLVARMLRPSWRHGLYQELDTSTSNTTLANAVDGAAAVAEASAAQLRQIVEIVVAEGYEELGSGFICNSNIAEEYLLELCDRGVLIGALGHRAGPRSLLMRMCEVHRFPESILTLGLEFYRDPVVRPNEFAAFVRRYGNVSGGWLLRALAEIDPDSMLKQTAYHDALGGSSTAGQAVGFHARHLANAANADADLLARFLDRHTDAQVLAFVLGSPVPDPVRSELLESRARATSDARVSDALMRREHRRAAASTSLEAGMAAALAATDAPDVLILLASNPRTPPSILRRLSGRRASEGARAIRNAAIHTLRFPGVADGRLEV